MINNIINCDLVVLGAGGCGLVAAVKAADVSGKKVIVLEKAKKPGGATTFAHGMQIKNSKWQAAAGLTSQNNSGPGGAPAQAGSSAPASAAKERIAGGPKRGGGPGPGATPDVSGQFFDWLVEKGGAEKYFKVSKSGDKVPMMGSISMPARMDEYRNHPDPSIGPGWMGTYFVEKMLECCEKTGIPVLTETRAKKFITDSQGKITGVLADTKDGELQVNCKACFIGAGGFGADYELLQKMWPEDYNGKSMHRFSPPTCTGDCIKMAEEIGAATDMSVAWVSIGGPAHHPYSYSIYRIMWQPENMYVNLNGERWIDETKGLSTISSALLVMQPKAEMYAVADNDLTEMLGERLIANPPEESDIPILKKFREDIAYEVSLDEMGVKGNRAKKADTLIELALKMDVDPKAFIAAVERYNAFCDKGQDLDFGKKPEYLKAIRNPPFYAFWGQRFTQCTHGGIVVNDNTEVLDASGKVMPGLFAGGDGTSSGDRGGGGLPGAINSGYSGGIAAGKYIANL
jgi:succinate dehydrogenase/fumarate reductase flavoprotein subunit